MRYHELLEDAQADITARDFVNTACKSVMQRLYNGVQPDRTFNMAGNKLFAYYPETLGLGRLVPNYLICLALQTGSEMSARVGPLGATVLNRYDHILIVDCLSSFEASAIPASQNNAFYSTFKHELTHVCDFIRTGSKINSKALDPNDQTEAGTAAYYNDNAEFNAYYHDVASKLSEIGGELKNTHTHADATRLLDQHDLIGAFRNDLHELLSGTDLQRQAFLEWISDRNRKKLLRRLYLLHVEVMKRVNELP